MDSIKLDDLKGGFGVSAVIKNTGELVVSDIEWSIDFGEVAKIGNYSSGTISTISVGDEVVIRSGFVFGIGSGSVTVVAGDFSIVQKYVMIGPLILLKSGLGNRIKNHDMIVYYRYSDHKTLDPADAYDTESMDVISQIYDTLVAFKGNDTLNFYPSLATSWSVAEDGKTWIFNLRRDVKFSNGNDFTAEDVKYSFNRVLTMGAPETGVDWILAQNMDTNSITVIDDHTVQIKLVASYGGFLATLAFGVGSIVDSETVESHGGVIPDTENIWMKENAIGTGPYMVKNNDNNSEILLIKNPYYWGGWNGNHVDKVLFKTTLNLEERISALKNGDADFTYLPNANLTDLIGEKGIVVQPFDCEEIVVLSINTKAGNNQYLADGRVRKALSYVFDYETAIDTAWYGYASRYAGVIPNGVPYYETQNNGQPYYNYDLALAEQILDNAGYTKSYNLNGKLYRFNGTHIRLFHNPGNSEREMMADIFQAALDEIGIRSSVIVEGWPQLLNRMYTTGDWDMLFIGWWGDYNDPDDFISPIIGSADIYGDTWNTGYKNETVDEKILEGKYSLNTTVRAAAYKAAYDIYIQEPPVIFLMQRQYIRPMRDWIMNYSYNPAPGLNFDFYDCYKGYN